MLSTHDLEQAAERFDRAMLLNRRGGLRSPAEVFTQERLLPPTAVNCACCR
jgi:ABC-type Mn2+/Zn2+ transport system ATPase subunit